MEIRFAQAQDVPGILSLLRQTDNLLHQCRPEVFRRDAQPYGASQVLGMLDRSATPVFVAVEEEKVLGCGFCQVKTIANDPVVLDRTELRIESLCVDTAVRRQGIGTALYKEICRYAQMRKCDSIRVNVWRCNEGGLRFFEKQGLSAQTIGMEMPLKEK